MIYRIAGSPFLGALKVSSATYGLQLWALGNRPGYKSHLCCICSKKIAANTERMYRPMGNPGNRMIRICIPCGG